MKKFNVFLDDVREGYNNAFDAVNAGWEDWVVVRHTDHVKTLLKADLVNEMSLDHDMGNNSETGQGNPTGNMLAKWMEQNNIWPDGMIYVHSANPVGAKAIMETVKKHNEKVSGRSE
jgi:hypothetical protein